MKISTGPTVREAVSSRPITGLRRADHENIKRILTNDAVAINYNQIQGKNVKYYWKCKGPFCYYVIDQKAEGKPVEKESGKILYFKSIRRAMEWIYDHDKEYYDSLPNLSEMKGVKEHKMLW